MVRVVLCAVLWIGVALGVAHAAITIEPVPEGQTVKRPDAVTVDTQTPETAPEPEPYRVPGRKYALLIGIGAFVRRVVGQRSLAWFEGLVARIPLVNTVYGSTRKLLDLLQTKPGTTQRVVLIDFPHDKMKSVGLVTRTLRDEKTGRELAAVYVPTTPNPTSGYLELVPVEYLTPTDWSVDEAMAFIISGGAVSRERVPFDRNSGSSVET